MTLGLTLLPKTRPPSPGGSRPAYSWPGPHTQPLGAPSRSQSVRRPASYNASTVSLAAALSFVVAAAILTGGPWPAASASVPQALPQARAAGPSLYYGLCDASAVVALNGDFFAVADDEDNVIRVYQRGGGGRPVHSVELSSFLQVTGKAREVDLEGAARVGDRIYWISSHGRNLKGKEAPNRQRFFATSGVVSNNQLHLQPLGRPYTGLLRDLLREPRLAAFDLAAAALRPPKAVSALNIEGLAATPEGSLLIGFRNPLPRGRALLVPLLNPADLLEGGQARFGEPILLDLEGQGIRSLTRCQQHYLIIAGSHAEGGASRLFLWDGFGSPQVLKSIDFGSLNPEAIAYWEAERVQRLFVVSDDGCVKVAGVECKRLPFARLKRFRALDLDLGLSPVSHHAP